MGSQSQSQSHSQSKQPNEDDGCSNSTAGQQTELVELCVTVQHAAAKADDSPADEDRAVEGLQAMLKCHVSTEILMATQVGKMVRKLSKQHSSNTRIHAAAQQVMEKWKAVVAAEAQAKPAATGHANASSKDGAAAEHSGKPKAEKDKEATLGGSGSKKEGGLRREDVHERGSGGAAVKNSDSGAGLASPRGSNPSTPRSLSQDGAKARALPGDAKLAPGNAGGNSRPSPGGGGGGGGRGGGAAPAAAAAPVLKPVPYTGHATRDKLRDLLVQALSLVAGEVTGSDVAAAAAVDLVDACVAVEKELWRLYGGTKDLKDYKAKYRSISFNLKDPRNPDLRRRVLLGEISAAKLVTMTAEEMASDAQRAANAETKRKLTEEAVRGQQTAASTDQFKCGRCGQRKCTYFQMQTRSADEPMTTFVTCINCNNRWKFC